MSEFKDKWIAALRSGEYTQDRGRLKTQFNDIETDAATYGHCCLGVAAEICDALEFDRKWGGDVWVVKDLARSQATYNGPELELLTHVPIPSILESSRKTDSIYFIAWRLNDEYRWTFEQIADWLETLDF